MTAVLAICVTGTVALGLVVDVAVLVGWIRGKHEFELTMLKLERKPKEAVK